MACETGRPSSRPWLVRWRHSAELPRTPPFERAATLLESLVQNHGFVEGNTRAAVIALGLWLEREGYTLDAARGELADLALAVALRKMSVASISSWLEARTVAIESGREPGFTDHATSEEPVHGPIPEL